MTKPASINAQLAVTCNLCGDRILKAAYPAEDHSKECVLNTLLQALERDKLKRVEVSDDLDALLLTNHNLPFTVYRILIPNGEMLGVYAPNWLAEGLNMYDNMHIEGMSLGEFLTTLAP